MDFEHFIDLCGRSLFPEEYRGDLDAAWDYLQQSRPDTEPLDEPAVHADYLRCSAIYSILVGRLSDAYRSLETLKEILDKVPQEWGLRYTNYKVLTDYTRRYPPNVRFYHERARPVNLTMLSNIIGPNEITETFMANVHKYLPLGIPRDQGLCQILGAVQWFPIQARNMTAKFHPLSPGGRAGLSEEDIVPLIAEQSKNLLKYRTMAEKYDMMGIAAYLTRLIVEFHLTSQSPAATTEMEGLFQRYQTINDPVGMANSKILEADNLLSPPFASPLSLNLIVVDVTSADMNDILWDPIEFDLAFEYLPRAKELYEEALLLFQAAGCRRGQAAVLLRQACCLHNLARHQRQSNKQILGILGDSEAKLQQSFQLFGKDEANLQIVKSHQIMVDITKGNPHNVKSIARNIGLWAVEAQNESMGHFIGMLLSRYAHQEWFKYSNMDTALTALECAYEVFETLGDIVPLFQSIVSRANVQHEMFNSNAARIHIEEALSIVDRVREYFDEKIKSAPDTPLGKADRATLSTSKFTALWTFSRKVGNIYIRIEDLQGFNDWNKKFFHWVEHEESFREFRERLDDYYSEEHPHFGHAFSQKQVKELWRTNLIDDVARVHFASAELTYRRLLDDGDIMEAEQSLRNFVNMSVDFEKFYSRDLYRILACERIGDSSKAREIMGTIDDNQLFNDMLEGFLNGEGVRHFFSTLAENALTFTIYAGDQARARHIVDLIIKIAPTFFESMNESALDYSFRLGHFGTIMKEEEPLKSFSKLLECRQIIEVRRIQTKDLDARIGNSAAGWGSEVFLNLARICLDCNQSNLPLSILSGYELGHFGDISWIEHALLFVEMGRARSVLESLQAQASQSKGMPGVPETADLSEAVQKRRLLRSLLALKTLSPEQEKEVSQLGQEIKALEKDGAISSATAFIETVNSTIEPKLLYQSIDHNSVVIEATFSARGFIAFAVTRDGIQKTQRGTTRNVDIRRPVMQAMKIMREMTGYLGEEEEARKRTLNDLSRDISAVVLEPFADTVRTKSHVIFSVSDPMTAFPFSILLFDGKPLIMHAAVSQVPSLTVLHYLSQRKSESRAPTISVLAKSPTEGPPEPLEPTRSNKEVNLHMAGIEAVNIARLFATWPIEASHMTRKSFREYVEGDSLIMHIGTHGDVNHRNPLLSSISIGDGEQFRVADMFAIRSRVNLLVFAACLSGLGKATIGSEVLGFSHVVLSTGCQAYIGSLWKVSDFGSMLVMTFFYRHLKSDPHLAVAEIMRKAQIDILQLDGEKASLFLDDMLDTWTSSGHEGQSPAEFVPDAEFLLLTLKMILNQLDWTSPFYWAPFTLVGYGGLRFVHED
ncbi:hypothetical protein N7462_003783 [Penicillium macrosclerotiorum]|uniref:uncharacterized protein n=1 Tax=Penicillium macrosclerotiorum TaxID=303699 RepID=UPI00254757A2|nr:uncharacterized protein N7462_003783 [Penicillium macrosclerotiorum]KAJ5689391.1 hypothetical protein N7462_003783 [Penicillium macrosclerotiorum]